MQIDLNAILICALYLPHMWLSSPPPEITDVFQPSFNLVRAIEQIGHNFFLRFPKN